MSRVTKTLLEKWKKADKVSNVCYILYLFMHILGSLIFKPSSLPPREEGGGRPGKIYHVTDVTDWEKMMQLTNNAYACLASFMQFPR